MPCNTEMECAFPGSSHPDRCGQRQCNTKPTSWCTARCGTTPHRQRTDKAVVPSSCRYGHTLTHSHTSHTHAATHKSMHARANITARVLSIDGTPLQQFKKCIIRGDVLIRCLQHSDGKEIFFLSFHTSFVTDDQVPCSPCRAAVRSLR